MSKSDPYLISALKADEVILIHGITKLPVDPISIARNLEFLIEAKPVEAEGVSGMLLRAGNKFGIVYASHIDNVGFKNFSIAHELGHYFLPGHIDAVFDTNGIHQSTAGFFSKNNFELEADHFAANLLMPRVLFNAAINNTLGGFEAIERLSKLCQTSLTATGIRYTQYSRDPIAVVLSKGERIEFCFMSDSFKEIKGINWAHKGETLSKTTRTFAFNKKIDNILQANQFVGKVNLQDWFGGNHDIPITEEVIGLGSYGKTLTVLTIPDLDDRLEDIEEENELLESWTPRFRR